jgi:hypothetical protein
VTSMPWPSIQVLNCCQHMRGAAAEEDVIQCQSSAPWPSVHAQLRSVPPVCIDEAAPAQQQAMRGSIV